MIMVVPDVVTLSVLRDTQNVDEANVHMHARINTNARGVVGVTCQLQAVDQSVPILHTVPSFTPFYRISIGGNMRAGGRCTF